MTATTSAQLVKTTGTVSQVTPITIVPKRLTEAAYFKRYRDREDGFKYELVDGLVEKTPRTMTPAQSYILRNLHHRFIQTKAYSDGGDLQVEIEMNTKPGQIRKPDICYRSAAQIASGDFSVSAFLVEVLSPNDKIKKVKTKIREYFAAGVQALWLIDPEAEEVEVYTSSRQSQVFMGNEQVSAAPAIPDFSMTVEEVFRKPVVPAEGVPA